MTIPTDSDLKLTVALNMPDSVVAQNIYYFKTSFNDAQEAEDVITSLEGWVEALYTEVIDYLSDLITLGEMVLYKFNTITSLWDNQGSGTPTVTFTGAGDMLPHGVAAMVRAYSTEPRTVGRKYIPGMTETSNVDGAWDAGTLTHLAAFGAAWDDIETMSAGNILTPGVWTTKYSAVYLMSGVQVILADPAYQRRRRPGVGS